MGDRAFRRGREGEAAAARYLQTRGWRILARNWRDGPRELDLVARRDDVLAFVEVKTRTPGGWGHPLESLTRAKRRELERAARAWLGAQRLPVAPDGRRAPRTVRFDVIVVWIGGGAPPDVEHVPDAWRPGWAGA